MALTRKILLVVYAVLFCGFTHGGLDGRGLGGSGVSQVPSQAWQILPEGAGGNLLRLDVAYDGANTSITATTDTYGSYIWNPSATAPNGVTGTWQQLVNSSSMPATYVSNYLGLGAGTYALAFAPSAAQTGYMVFDAFVSNQFPATQGVYKTTDQGAHWTLTNFTIIDVKQYFGDGDGAGYAIGIKQWGPRIAIDPTDPTIVAVSTGANGLKYSTDGGSTWNTSSIATATIDANSNYPGYTGIAISKSNHSLVIASSYGNGVYKSTTGLSGTFSRINSGVGPVDIIDAVFDPANTNYYCIDGNGNGWQYAGTTWTQVYSGGNANSVTVDPNTANHVIIGTGNGTLSESTNGTTFGAQSSQATTATNDVTWLQPFTANVNVLRFDPITAKKLWTTTNRAAFTTTYTGTIGSGTTISWALQARGIEQLVANRVIVPATNTPITTSWDTAAFTPSFNSYPNTQPVVPGPGSATSLFGGWSIDYCTANPNFVVLIADGDGDGSGQHSAYSQNLGAAWTAFSPLPSNVYNGSTGASQGSIACNGSGSNTTTNVVWCPNGAVACSYTTNCCSSPTWNLSTSPPGTSGWSGFTGGSQNGAIAVAADRVNASTFDLYYNGVGFFQSTDGGHTWSSLASYTSLVGAFQIKATTGQAGDFWFSGGNNQPGNRQPCGTDLLHYHGSTLTTITNLVCPASVGFGVSSTGSGYPAVYAAGFVGGVFGIYRSDNAGSGTATPTWTLVGGGPPNNSLDQPRDVSGDPSVYGQVIAGFGGSGWAIYR